MHIAVVYVVLSYGLFTVYVMFAVRQYGRWLRNNYTDLDRKEVWQSLVFAVVLFAVYMVYTSNASEGQEENREWWEIESIRNGLMKWKALRQREDGITYTATFEMTKVQ